SPFEGVEAEGRMRVRRRRDDEDIGSGARDELLERRIRRQARGALPGGPLLGQAVAPRDRLRSGETFDGGEVEHLRRPTEPRIAELESRPEIRAAHASSLKAGRIISGR